MSTAIWSLWPTPRRHADDRTPPLSVRGAIEDVGAHVLAWRRLRRLSRAEVAERAQISLTTLAALEGGQGGTSLENLLRVARVLGTMDALVTALDPFETDVGRMGAREQMPKRVRRRRAPGPGP